MPHGSGIRVQTIPDTYNVPETGGKLDIADQNSSDAAFNEKEVSDSWSYSANNKQSVIYKLNKNDGQRQLLPAPEYNNCHFYGN